MTWWKKILSTIPLLVAGYEVGKSTDGNDQKEVIEVLRSIEVKKNEKNLTDDTEINYVQILSIIAVILLAVIYVARIICAAMMERRNSRSIQQEI